MQEKWKNIIVKRGNDIIDFTGFYQVSNFGNVRSVDRKVTYSDGRVYQYVGKPMALQRRKRDWYVYVRLDKNQIVVVAKVHRLVAEAFIPNPENKPLIDHINTNRCDNRESNLRWVTPQENTMNQKTRERRSKATTDAMERILKARKERHGKRAEKTTIQCDLQGNVIREFKSIMQIYREYGYDPSRISKCCRGISKTCHGYIWKYKDNQDQVKQQLCAFPDAEADTTTEKTPATNEMP